MRKYLDHGLPYFPSAFRFAWPERDDSLYGDIGTLEHLDEYVMPLVEERRVCIQAGGAVGVWPKRLAQLFEMVYTFEPHPENFDCLVRNCPESNIVKLQAAVSNRHEIVSLGFPEHPTNYGGFYVTGVGTIPAFRIDDLDVPYCDLLMLDVEGCEWKALQGAQDMLDDYHPVIALEDKSPCTRRFGYNPGDISRWLIENFDYTEVARYHGGRDVVLKHNG